MKKVFIGSDHAGLSYKTQLLNQMKKRFSNKYEFEDVGCFDNTPVDYPDIADLVCEKVKNQDSLGVLICGSGIGMSMRANQHQEIRAAVCWDQASASLSRQHNDANVVCLGARLIPPKLAQAIIEIFLTEEFSKVERHQNRINKLKIKPKK